jgi:hypothetical protein
MANEIAQITVCRACGKRFIGPSGESLLLGTSPRAGHFLVELVQHLIRDHPQQDGENTTSALNFLGFLRLRNFMTRDPAVLTQLDYRRWQVHQETLPVQIHDETIESQSREFAQQIVAAVVEFCKEQTSEPLQKIHVLSLDSAPPSLAKLTKIITEKVAELASGFRDVYQEPGKYTQPPSSSPAVLEH